MYSLFSAFAVGVHTEVSKHVVQLSALYLETV